MKKTWLLSRHFLLSLAFLFLTLGQATGQSIQFSAGPGSFPVDPGGYGHGASFGAFTRNGRPSIFAISYGTANFLYDNVGGYFEDITARAGVQFGTDHDRGMASADYDNDGDIDIYISAGYTGNVFWRNDGDDTFTDIISSSGTFMNGQGQGVAWGDVNNDGWLDLFVCQTNGDNRLFIQSGDRFYEAGDFGAESGSLQPVFFDVNNDGRIDLLVTRRAGLNNLLYINNGNGSFTEQGGSWGIGYANAECHGAVVGDYDRDGDLDVYICNYAGVNMLFRNMGGHFDEVGAAAGVQGESGGNRGAVFGDFDDDGWPDLYVVRSGSNRMFRNNGNGTFTDVSGSSGAADGNAGYSPSIADYDNDGDLDIFFTNTGQHSVLLQNLGPFNNWAEFRLRGGSTNLNGVGATLTAWIQGRPQAQAVIAGQGYLGTGSDLTVHFGLGRSNQIDSLIVQWPSGARDYLYHFAANQKISLYEGSTPPRDTSPPQISEVSANNVTTTTATINWMTDERADSQIEYGQDANYGNFSALDDNLVTSHAMTLSNLAASTTYHFRVRSKDASGNATVSNDFIFTTARDTQAPVISNVATSNISMTAATVSWNTDEPADSQIEYGLDNNYGTLSNHDANRVTEHSIALSNLTAGTTYHFRAISQDTAGNFARSKDITFTTARDMQAPTISNIATAGITANSAQITWNTDELSLARVEYGPDSTLLASAVVDTAFALSHTVTLANLQPYTTYYFHVLAKDEAGNMSTSRKYSFNTLSALASIILLAGNAQTGDPGEILAAPLLVKLVDRFGVGMPNVQVEFRVIAGSGRVIGQPACDSSVCVVVSDQNGIASVKWRLGMTDSQKVQMTILENPKWVVLFTATLKSPATAVNGQVMSLPSAFALRNYPNPFHDFTQFEVALPASGLISLKIFDVQGREVSTLAEEWRDAGRHFFKWEGRANGSLALTSGVYFAVLRYQSAPRYAEKQIAPILMEKQKIFYVK
jgi:type VI protein secretion system component Hcp